MAWQSRSAAMEIRTKKQTHRRLAEVERAKTPPVNFGSAGASPSRTMNAVTRVATTLVLAGIYPLAGLAQQPRGPNPDRLSAALQIEQSLVDVIARAEPSVVAIARIPAKQSTHIDLRPGDVFGDRRENASGAAAPITVGAGVIIDRAGLVLTDYLSIHDGDEHRVTTIDRTTYHATIRAADPHSGLAVLAIDHAAGPLQRAGSHEHNSAPETSRRSAWAMPKACAKVNSSLRSATRMQSRPMASQLPVGAS